MRIGIIGAGFMARGIGALALKHGCEVMLSNSRGPQTLTSTVASLGCQVGTVEEAARFGDVVVLAIPFGSYQTLEVAPFAGKIVLDTGNYYPRRDGQIPELDSHQSTTSEMLSRHLTGARVVKAFNAILECDLLVDSSSTHSDQRRALPIAGNDAHAKQVVSELHERFGYDVVDAGALVEGRRFERARPAYCRRFNSADLRAALADDGPDQAEGAWHG